MAKSGIDLQAANPPISRCDGGVTAVTQRSHHQVSSLTISLQSRKLPTHFSTFGNPKVDQTDMDKCGSGVVYGTNNWSIDSNVDLTRSQTGIFPGSKTFAREWHTGHPEPRR